MQTLRTRLLFCAFALTLPALVVADWTRYENDYFIVYSQGKEKKVKRLVRELELFRAAALQVFSVRAPDDAPKTLVVIAKDRKEYRQIGGSDRIAGFARREGPRTLIVMPSSGVAKENMNTARHEYAHALLGYDQTDYPSWYEEGFAELAALIEIDEKTSSFVLGLGTRRRIGARVLAVPWNDLIKDDFSAHRLSTLNASNAYGQAWLLMHYLAIGPNKELGQRLGLYVQQIREGVPSENAWQSSFERTPQEIWESEMQGYSEELPFYRLRFRALTLDDDFSIAPAPAEEIDRLLFHLQAVQRGQEEKRIKDASPADFVGWWSRPSFSVDCRTPIEIDHDEQANQLRIRWEQRDDADAPPNPVVYSIPEIDEGLYRIKQESEPDKGHIMVPEMRISLRQNGWLCIAHPDAYDRRCERAFRRCPQADTGAM